ncbi:MAG TPA: NUDIX hydrolase [Acidimicrobiales bacterium]
MGETPLLSSHVFDVVRLELSDPDGETFERDVVRHPGAVAVAPVDEAGIVTLVRQYRAAVAGELLEIPAGTCDVTGEAPETTARRELAEEAGLEASELRRLAAVRNSPGYGDQLTTVFLATGLRDCPTDRGKHEERWMSVERVDLRDLPRLVADGTLVDETTVLALWMARHALGIGA